MRVGWSAVTMLLELKNKTKPKTNSFILSRHLHGLLEIGAAWGPRGAESFSIHGHVMAELWVLSMEFSPVSTLL